MWKEYPGFFLSEIRIKVIIFITEKLGNKRKKQKVFCFLFFKFFLRSAMKAAEPSAERFRDVNRKKMLDFRFFRIISVYFRCKIRQVLHRYKNRESQFMTLSCSLRKVRDSNPRYPKGVYRISSPARSITLPTFLSVFAGAKLRNYFCCTKYSATFFDYRHEIPRFQESGS